MLVAILNANQNVMYITKNSAPREIYRKKLTEGKYRKAYVDNLFIKVLGVLLNLLKMILIV